MDYDRIDDPAFRQAVDLIDAGDLNGLRRHLDSHPGLSRQRVVFEGGGYFANPALLSFVAENPIRRPALPANITEIAKAILDAGAKQDRAAVDETLGLVSSGRLPRECGVQTPLIDLLCDYGADPNSAMLLALTHGEFDAVDALIRRGARMDLPVCAALGRTEDFGALLAESAPEERHRALAFAAQFGRAEIVKLLLESGEGPNRYNPPGTHAHSTPLHQAAVGGHFDVVRLLVEAGANLDLQDTAWHGTAEGWAVYGHNFEIAEYLHSRARQNRRDPDNMEE